MKSSLAKWLWLLFWIAVCFAAAAAGARFSPGEWYENLNRPSWAPPNWLFGPVWTALYLCMALAAWLVTTQEGFENAKLPLAVFLLQLCLNALWSWLFFGLHRMDFALADILLLDAAIAATIMLFWRIVPLAGYLLVPYLAWVLFATALNFSYWRLNQ